MAHRLVQLDDAVWGDVSELPNCRVCDLPTQPDQQRAGFTLTHTLLTTSGDEERQDCLCVNCNPVLDPWCCSNCDQPITNGSKLITKDGNVYCDPCVRVIGSRL